ncbi:lipase family protein [Branchiibius hedensis]|nr:lipase family protein [Branchiibius hedensis]
MSRQALARVRRCVIAVVVLCLVTAGMFLMRPASALAAPAPTSTQPATTVLNPSVDPFYTPNVPLAPLKPGTPIKTRTVRVITSQNKKTGKTTSISATQVLYRTTNALGQPAAAVTTIIRPRVKGKLKLISYHAPYDTLGSQCDPSYTLQGSGTGAPQEVDLIAAEPLLAEGYTVVIPDYEGLQDHWTIGKESAYAALDSVRVSEKILHAPSSTPVGLMGYSGGSVPTGFAADLAPTYAPELTIVGAAAGGVLVDPAHNLPYIDGTPLWSSVIPALMYSYNATYNLDINQYLSTQGVSALQHVAGQCLTEFLGNPGNITDSSLLQPQWPSLLSIPALIHPLNDNIMGASGVPRTPMFLGVGNISPNSGNPPQPGDGIMLVDDVAGLATQYCKEHVKTQFRIYPKLNHFQAFLPWLGDANAFMNARFAGKSAVYCKGIPQGVPLTPLPPIK